MVKKLSSIILIFIILAVSSTAVFAVPPDGGGAAIKPATTGEVNASNSLTEKSVTGESNAIEVDAATQESNAGEKKTEVVKKIDFKAVFDKTMKAGATVNKKIITMTSPDPLKEKDSTYKKAYILSGHSEYSDVIVAIAKYNKDTDEYERMYNTDGESMWEIGDFRLFSKEITLTEGVNKIMVMACKKSQAQDSVMDNVQVNCFTVELLNDSILGNLIKKSKEIGSEIVKGLGGIFGTGAALK